MIQNKKLRKKETKTNYDTSNKIEKEKTLSPCMFRIVYNSDHYL